MNKIIIFVAAVAIGIGGAYFLVQKGGKQTTMDQQLAGKSAAYEWTFTELEQDATGMFSTAVSISSGGTTYSLGSYAGSCHEVMAGTKGVLGDESDPGEVSRAQCWFAGAGDEIGIFEDGPKRIVRVGELGEGTSEDPAFRGNFKTILEL